MTRAPANFDHLVSASPGKIFRPQVAPSGAFHRAAVCVPSIRFPVVARQLENRFPAAPNWSGAPRPVVWPVGPLPAEFAPWTPHVPVAFAEVPPDDIPRFADTAGRYDLPVRSDGGCATGRFPCSSVSIPD